MKPRIAYTTPSSTELDMRYASDAMADGWGEQCCVGLHTTCMFAA